MAFFLLLPVFHYTMELLLCWSKDGTTEQLQSMYENDEMKNLAAQGSDMKEDEPKD